MIQQFLKRRRDSGKLEKQMKKEKEKEKKRKGEEAVRKKEKKKVFLLLLSFKLTVFLNAMHKMRSDQMR